MLNMHDDNSFSKMKIKKKKWRLHSHSSFTRFGKQMYVIYSIYDVNC